MKDQEEEKNWHSKKSLKESSRDSVANFRKDQMVKRQEGFNHKKDQDQSQDQDQGNKPHHKVSMETYGHMVKS